MSKPAILFCKLKYKSFRETFDVCVTYLADLITHQFGQKRLGDLWCRCKRHSGERSETGKQISKRDCPNEAMRLEQKFFLFLLLFFRRKGQKLSELLSRECGRKRIPEKIGTGCALPRQFFLRAQALAGTRNILFLYLSLFFKRKVTKRIVRYLGNFILFVPHKINRGLRTHESSRLLLTDPHVFSTAIAW